MNTYVVKVVDAKYDENNKTLVLNCFFELLQELRIIYMPKSDFVFDGKKDFPDVEMEKTAELFKGKRFNLQINDDPNRCEINKNNSEELIKDFRKNISNTIELVQNEMNDNEKKIDRRIEDIIDKQKDRDNQIRQLLNGKGEK